jgi:hypothetical protein
MNRVQITQITVPGLEMQYRTHSTPHRSQAEQDTAIWPLSLQVVTAVRCTAVQNSELTASVTKYFEIRHNNKKKKLCIRQRQVTEYSVGT